MHYKLNNTTWEYEPKMTIDDFVNANLDYYTQQHLERYPEEAHLLDDWAIECIERKLDYGEVREVMNILYNQFLDDN